MYAAPAGAVVEGEDDEESVYSEAPHESGSEGPSEGSTPRDGRRSRASVGAGGSPRAPFASGPPVAVRRVPVSQNQLKLGARIDSFDRKTLNSARTKNEKALSQLRASTASLQRATQAAQGAKRAVDAAFDELRKLITPPEGEHAADEPHDA